MYAAFGQVLTTLVAFVLSLGVHEWAHAVVANFFGDSTARREGRMTINPIVHMDLVGTVLMPVLGILLGGGILAWAKPVPVDSRYVRHGRIGLAIVSGAGPISNFLLAITFSFLVVLYGKYFPVAPGPGHYMYPLVELAKAMIFTNVILFAFNAIPIPPLDGASVVSNVLLPAKVAAMFDEIGEKFGFTVLLILSISGKLQWVSQFSSRLAAEIVDTISLLVN